MIEATAIHLAGNFPEFLAAVERGEIVRIRDQGRRVARLVPDGDFMPGHQAAAIFEGHLADPQAADAIDRELRKLDLEADHALDH